eukprot:1898067-Prymnesium_polylepis.2
MPPPTPHVRAAMAKLAAEHGMPAGAFCEWHTGRPESAQLSTVLGSEKRHRVGRRAPHARGGRATAGAAGASARPHRPSTIVVNRSG